MRVAVTSPSFSKHPDLIAKMGEEFPDAKLNLEGLLFSKSELVEYLKDYDAAIVGLDEIDDEVLSQLPHLKIIAKYGVGLNNIDLEACKKYNVKIGWTGGVNRVSVAEMVLGNALSLLRNLYQTSNLLSDGVWKKDGGEQLTGKTVGIIGVGFIGKELIKMLKPFNCKILVNDVINQDAYYAENKLIEASKEEIFKNCDVITIHTPLTIETKYILNKQAFDMMKSNAIILNTARGGIVEENDLYFALTEGKIKAASLDVYEEEPPTNMKLLSLPNLICTPHIGGNAKEAVLAMGMSAIGHLIDFKIQ
ncbi:hydroxyacid dehydrogenase [Vicingus serpentipes]|uniref:Hydroxyacid dehydrogenase n=1 Tax=Vicingus serpentipes TaxID=1926625 RepID=A0A5C6RU55_9FLAO|nr:phosphoglycerate dehydrogenase [Vicingus serpentipes]TXB65495.1 hydroxyacid dehydrogenase [Vicingus serpentipes]